jgi:CRP-like cAMP-binding protein
MGFNIGKYHFKKQSILDNLPFDDLQLLQENLVQIELKKGNILFKEKSYSKGMYILKKGKIKIYKTNSQGQTYIVYIYAKDELLSYRALLCNEPHPVSAEALEDCMLFFIPKNILLQALQTSPVLSNLLLTNLSHEFAVWINTISFFAQQPVKEKVALALLILNEKYKKKNVDVSTINLSRNDLANYVGTTKETLVRMLRLLKDEKIIHTQGRKINVLTPHRLERIAKVL